MYEHLGMKEAEMDNGQGILNGRERGKPATGQLKSHIWSR